jgi:gamma-glutamyltranspeptidase
MAAFGTTVVRRHAKLPWQELLGPSVNLADQGLSVDWWTTLMIASAAADLRRYSTSAAAYLEDGLPPNAQWGIRSCVRLPQDGLKATLAHLAVRGPRDFYEGDLARSIAADVQAGGGALSVDDLASFRAYCSRAAGNSLPRWQGLRDAGTQLRPDPRACLAPTPGEFAARARRARC